MSKKIDSEIEKGLFHFEVDTFEKGDGEKSRRIGGFASTETIDRDGESLLQKGLDFTDFLEHGWFNDDHDKGTDGVVGYPEVAKLVKGKGWYVEGFLLKGTKKADSIWELAKALEKSNRKLGFSVQGSVVSRKGNNKILKARIKHVAITHSPTNPECTLEILSKSICCHIDSEECIQCTPECVSKAIEVGHSQSPVEATGVGAIAKESLEGHTKCTGEGCEHKKKKKGLSKSEIEVLINKRGYSKETSSRIATMFQNSAILDKLTKEV